MSLRHPLRLLVLIVGLTLAAGGVEADAPAATPSSFISGLVDSAVGALANKQLTQEDRAKEFHALLDRDFDMPRISRFVLGRYWKEASDTERQHFLQLFEEYVVRSYAQRFAQYSGETVKVTGARPEGETTTLVQSEVLQTSGAPPAKVDWRVRKDEDGFKIVDVDVEGVSMVLTQREEFSSVIERAGGVAGLNRELEQKLASGDTTMAAPLPKKE
ncbi:MAG TPA: ABC transporter substrate-binding protein [Stellaceae bacterium]|jgi:phospholipid transport system substrate-binding protein|nr:ABC transporter substrate-binding protein [Stellaceae bacterium]